MSAALATPALTMHKRSFSSPEMGALVDHEYPDPSPIRSHASERNLEQMGARLGDRQEEALVEVRSARAHQTFPETRGACAERDERGYRFTPLPSPPSSPVARRRCCEPRPWGRPYLNSTRGTRA